MDDSEIKYSEDFRQLKNGIKKMRILHIKENNDISVSNSELKSIVSHIKEKDGYIDYVYIKEDGNTLNVIVKEKNTKIKSLVLISTGDDGFTILNLKTDIDMETLKNANLSFNKNKEH